MLFLFDESVVMIGDDVPPCRLERTLIDLEMLCTLEVVDVRVSCCRWFEGRMFRAAVKDRTFHQNLFFGGCR